MCIYTIFYLPVVNSYWQPVVNSDFAIDNRLSIATSYYLFILLFTYKLICKDFHILYIIRKGFYCLIFRYKPYQVTSLDSLDTTPLKSGTYPTIRVVDGSEQ